MISILNQHDYEGMTRRVEHISKESTPLWGKMTAHEMVCHATDIVRDVLGVRQVEPMTPPEMRPQIIAMVITENEWDKNIDTFPPYLQGEGGGGTKPVDFESDKRTLLDLLRRLYETDDQFQFSPHAGLGILSREQNGVFIWKHTDHHLRQFGL